MLKFLQVEMEYHGFDKSMVLQFVFREPTAFLMEDQNITMRFFLQNQSPLDFIIIRVEVIGHY